MMVSQFELTLCLVFLIEQAAGLKSGVKIFREISKPA